MDANAFSEPSVVTVDGGTVFIDGPDGVAFSLTPAAAEETAARLHEAAALARAQAEQTLD